MNFGDFFLILLERKKKRKKTSIKLKYCKFCRTVWRVCIKWIERKMATIKDTVKGINKNGPILIVFVGQVVFHQEEDLKGEKKLVSEIDLRQLTILTKKYPVTNCNPSN